MVTVRVKVPKSPPGNLFEAGPKILLSQGEVRPGMWQGQHWGQRRRRLPPGPHYLVER
jgi:hypothetical protein